jgi:hypothetical protein
VVLDLRGNSLQSQQSTTSGHPQLYDRNARDAETGRELSGLVDAVNIGRIFRKDSPFQTQIERANGETFPKSANVWKASYLANQVHD